MNAMWERTAFLVEYLARLVDDLAEYWDEDEIRDAVEELTETFFAADRVHGYPSLQRISPMHDAMRATDRSGRGLPTQWMEGLPPVLRVPRLQLVRPRLLCRSDR